MIKLLVNILEFLCHPELLNDTCHSDVQKVCLKSIYGLLLNSDELQMHERGTGRKVYAATEQREITIIAGRRSGKTGKIAAPICCFEAFRNHGLPPGEEAHVMLLAHTLKQAKLRSATFAIICETRRFSPAYVRITGGVTGQWKS